MTQVTEQGQEEDVATVQLVPDGDATTAIVGVWRPTAEEVEDRIPRVVLHADEWPMLPHEARLLAGALLAGADRAEGI